MRLLKPYLFPLLLSLTSTLVAALGQKTLIAFNETSSADFPLVSSTAAPILVSSSDFAGVKRAVATWAGDIGNVTSQTPQVLNELTEGFNTSGSVVVVVGSVGSPFVNTLVNAGAMNVSDIQGRWESFKIQIVDGSSIGVDRALVVVGSDKRGTIYGLYDLSEQMGVSPWSWWADVPISKHKSLFVLDDIYVHGSPTVKYRGLFLNDEQPSLQNWAIERYQTNSSAPFQHEFYEEVYELLLRLKANMFWPAMWSAKFAVDDPLNQMLADDYGVIYSTSHQEPMARNTPEWGAYGNGIWNYTTNKAFLNNFWSYGVERAKPFETIYTVGMRGDGDLPLPGANIAIIQNIIEDQRAIISNVTQKNATETPQILCLYKEVQSYWDVPSNMTKLEVDEDVTLLWTDDNWGNIRRVPSDSEKMRSGGAGVYYHFDYVGDPRNYKWINTVDIHRVHEQLSLALEFGANRLFIVNVGDLKPLEMPMNFYFEYAYDSSRWNKDNLDEYLVLWATREYGADAAYKVANVFERYMRFVARVKPELDSPSTFSLVSFREADRVTSDWNTLINDAWAIYNSLDSDHKDTFFQTVLHPVRAVGTVVLLNLAVGQNNLRAVQARMSTNTKATEAQALFSEDAKLTVEYHTVNSGKWNHMMDQPHLGQWGWQQNMINTLPALNYLQASQSTLPGPLRVSVQGSLGVWPGDALNQCAQGYNCPPPVLPLLTPYSEPSRWFDISHGASSTVDWSWYAGTNASSFVKLSKTEGQVSGEDSSTWETRVEVSVHNWTAVPAGLQNVQIMINTTTVTNDYLTAPGAPMTFAFNIPVQALALPANVSGVYVESDGGVSIEAAHASRNTTVNGTKWEVIPGYSPRTSNGAAVSMFPRVGPAFAVGSGPKLEYDFFTFNNQTGGNVTVNLYLGTSLNFQFGRPLQYAVQIDDLAPQTVQPVPAAANAGANPPDWNAVVAANVRISSTNHTLPSGPGKHTLSVWGVEQGVVLEKIVINTVAPGLVQKSYLGQPESMKV